MKRILVVDDEKELAEIVAEQLVNMGYEAGTAFDGIEAVLSVLDHHWDIVLMDIRMPKLDGINALKIIRKLAPEVVVISFTGHAAQAGGGKKREYLSFATDSAFSGWSRPRSSALKRKIRRYTRRKSWR